MAKLSQRQVVAEVKSHIRADGTLDGRDWSSESRKYFAQINGGEIQASVEKVYDGGSTFPEVLPAPIEVGDLTTTRHYDPDIDGELLDYYRPRVGRARFDINIYTIDADGNKIGYTRQYQNVLLVNITDPEGDSSAGGPATFSLTFAVSSVATSRAGGTTA
jgi:hypothetical protein